MIHLRLERRSATPPWLNLTLPLIALAVALVLCSGLVALAGANILDAYAQLFLTPFSTGFDLEQTAIKAAPLVLTGLAVAVAFRARFWNIGARASSMPAPWPPPSSAPRAGCPPACSGQR